LPEGFSDGGGGPIGDATSGESASVDDGACTMITTSVFANTCAVTGCHTSANPAGFTASSPGLDLESPDIFGRLVRQPSGEDPSYDYIDPGGNPTKSFLWIKLNPAPPGGGGQMPSNGVQLTMMQINCVATWIQQQSATRGHSHSE
jgi:hypothetical protein